MESIEDFKQFCQDCSELALFFTMYGLSSEYFWNVHEYCAGRGLSPSKFENWFQENMLKASIVGEGAKRFGVKTALINGKVTEEYKRWGSWWTAYLESLPDTELELVKKLAKEGSDVSKWRPLEDWKVA